MNNLISKLTVALVLTATAALAEDKVALNIELPKPLFVGTPVDIKGVPNLEPKAKGERPDFLVAPGTVNLAKGKKVTSSDKEPVIGTLDLLTDGDKEGDEGAWVELGPGKQWVQIDLEKESEIAALVVWHFHSQERVYLDVVVQASNDPAFEKDVTTLFDNTPGTGKDLAYVESYKGKLIDAKGVKARYVRLLSKGNTTNKLNHYIEVEVYGKPAA
jgi:hypothetical protein